MLNKITYVLLGILLIIFGVFLLFSPVYHDFLYDYYYNFGQYHKLLGLIFIGIGSLLSYWSYKKKPKYFEDTFLICPNCKKPFNEKDIKNKLCPECKIVLEKLDGFYERHPELK